MNTPENTKLDKTPLDANAPSGLDTASCYVSIPKHMLEKLLEIGWDYVNPDGVKYHGCEPVGYTEARKLLTDVHEIMDES